MSLDSSATYLLVGGLGGIGRSVAQYLALYGARHIIFISRSGRKPENQSFLETLRKQGAESVLIYGCDICDFSTLRMTIRHIKAGEPPIKGVIQAAAVVKDAVFENMSQEDFASVTQPKAQGSWNLHKVLPEKLNFFVILSSSAGVMGTAGQSNYAAGNCFEDALANHRRQQGFPCVSLDLCMILDVGMIAEDEHTIDILKNSGFIGIQTQELHKLVAAAIKRYSQGGAAVNPQVICGLGTGGFVIQNKGEDPYWLQDSRFSILRKIDLQLTTASTTDLGRATLRLLLSSTTSLREATEVAARGICQRLAKSIVVPEADVDNSRPVSDYGVDPLVAVEMRSWVRRELNADVSVFDILSPMSITELAHKIVTNLG